MTLDELRAIARVDFDDMNIPPELWDAFWAGYLSAVKRHHCDEPTNG